MQNLSKRFETFTNWPTTNTQTPKQVAEAGFYFTGKMMQIELNKVYSVWITFFPVEMLAYNRINCLHIISFKKFLYIYDDVHKTFNFGCENENWFVTELHEFSMVFV